MTILKDFVSDKICHLVQRDSALVHPESAPSLYPRVHLFKVYFFVTRFPTMSLNRIKLKYETMKPKAYEKNIWMIELDAKYLLRLKGSLFVHFENAL